MPVASQDPASDSLMAFKYQIAPGLSGLSNGAAIGGYRAGIERIQSRYTADMVWTQSGHRAEIVRG